jgi:hypothetical protein
MYIYIYIYIYRVKVNIADMFTHMIINIRSAGQTPCAWIYNLSKIVANARITRTGFDLLSKYGMTTSYSLFTNQLKQESIQNFYDTALSELDEIIQRDGEDEEIITLSYDNYVYLMFAAEMTDKKKNFTTQIASLTCISSHAKKHPGFLKNDDRPCTFPKFTNSEIDAAVTLIALGYLECDHILKVDGVSIVDEHIRHLSDTTPLASWPGTR